ncbi:type II toxin-antitoxin system TacA family antitoxin [Thiovibrio sp. JS02]
MPQTEARIAPINIRAKQAQRDLIDKAAATLQKNRSDFMLEAACREAENVLLDQRFFHLDSEAFAAFQATLNAPVADNPALRKLLASKAPWEK